MASASRSQISVQRCLNCPGCGEELNGNVPELPCGHCICRSCAKELESQNVQKCAMKNCASNRNAFEQRIKFSNLPRRSVVDIENNSMGLPPPYQELPSAPATTINYCEIHATNALRFFCKNCKISVCDICWDENHEDESKHAVITMNKYLQPQKVIQMKLGAYKTECNKLKDFLSQNQLTDSVNQVQNAERIQCEVLRSRTANEVEAKSNELKVALDAQMSQLKILKSEMLSQFALLETSFESIFKKDSTKNDTCTGNSITPEIGITFGATSGTSAIDGLCSSSDGSRTREKDKKRVLVEIRKIGKVNDFFAFARAAYDSNTRELLTFNVFEETRDTGITVFSVSGDGSDHLEVKRTMRWKALREDEFFLSDFCLDTTSNSLYVVVLHEEQGRKVEEIDRLSLRKKSELNTEGLLNGNDIQWFLTSKRDTMALAICDKRYKDNHKWHSVTMYKNKTRLYTVPLDMKTDGDKLPWCGCALITETTLLILEGQGNKVALVSLPARTQQQHHTHASASSTSSSSTEPAIINYLIAPEIKKIERLFWIPSGHPRKGYLLVKNEDFEKFDVQIFEVDLEKDLANVKHGQQQLTLRVAESVSALETVFPLCEIDHSAAFALMKESDGINIQLYAILIKLDFSNS